MYIGRLINNLMKFEVQDIEIITSKNGNPLFELYSTGMALGYVNKRKNSVDKQYTSPCKARIISVIESADITCVSRCHTIFNLRNVI
jgi:hypothetical protein